MVAKMTSNAETRINLKTLQRRDPYISNIIDSATQVAVYTFSHTSGEWEKTEVEGTLFVYSRIAPPTAGFTIVNRLSMENLTEPLTNKLEFQNQSPFLLYRNAKLQIYGIWFYDLYDCTRIGKLLIDSCQDERKVPSLNSLTNLTLSKSVNSLPSPHSTGSSAASSISDNVIEEDNLSNLETNHGSKSGVNIIDILFKAKDDYDKKNGIGQQVTHEPHSVLFQPVPEKNSVQKKLNLATLFGQLDEQKSNAQRPSSVEIFDKLVLSNNNNSSSNEQSKKRVAARSLSLSLASDQTLSQVENLSKSNIVNGTISVEELESPVMGMSSRRSRYHSSSESTNRSSHSPSLPIMEESIFNKLFGKGPTSSFERKILPSPPSPPGSEDLSHSVPDIASVNMPPKMIHRSHSNPGNLINYVPLTATNVENSGNNHVTAAPMQFGALLPSLAMPTLHENSHGMIKSMSVASGLSQMPHSYTQHKTQVSSTLHGTTTNQIKNNQCLLLSPHALKPTGMARNGDLTSTNTTSTNSLITAITSATTLPQPSVSAAITANGVASKNPAALISPEDFEHSTFTPQKAMELRQLLLPPTQPEPSIPTPMDKKHFLSTLVSLLQNDDSFLTTVHNAYVSGLNNAKCDGPPLNDAQVNLLMPWK